MAIDSVIFGFGYRSRSGKGTACDEIIKQRGLVDPELAYNVTCEGQTRQVGRYDIRKYSFADALRSEVNTLFSRSKGAMGFLVIERPTHLMQANENFIELPDS